MDNRLLSLQDYEKNQLGSWTITMTNTSSLWNEPENAQKAQKVIVSLYQELVEKLPGLLVLRAFIITSNVIEEYDRLLEGTGRRAKVDRPRDGMLAAKVLTWGECSNKDNYYGAIVIDERICAAATFDDSSECKALIVHEFTHVAEGYFTSRFINNKKEDIYHNEWEKIVFSDATGLFSEYFAQLVSYPYYKEQSVLEEHINYLITHLTSVNKFLNNEIAEYRYHADMNRLWPKVISELSRIFDQIGRSIGLLVCFNNEMYEPAWNCFINKIKQINPLWVPVINEFRDALTSFDITNLERTTFDPICNAIKSGYNAAGFIPETLKDGTLYIHVPF